MGKFPSNMKAVPLCMVNSWSGIQIRGCLTFPCFALLMEFLEGLVFPVISLKDLRANKRALGRHQDLADLEELDDECETG